MLLEQNTVHQVLATHLIEIMPGKEFGDRLVLADEEYVTVDVSWLLSAIKTDPILSPKRYTRNVFDCDDYVMYLKVKASLYAQLEELDAPLAVGLLLTSKHAFNFCIDDLGDLVLVNTQSGDHKTERRPQQFSTFLGVADDNAITLIYL